MTGHDPDVGGTAPDPAHGGILPPDHGDGSDLGYGIWETPRRPERQRWLHWYHIALAALVVICTAFLVLWLTESGPPARPVAASSSVTTVTATATQQIVATTTVTASAQPAPAPTTQLTPIPTAAPVTQTPVASSGPVLSYCPWQSNCVLIDLSSACTWAFPGQASGQTIGSWDSIQCLDISGNPLGGFVDGSGHSLNDWCGYVSDQNGVSLRQAKVFGPTTWVCVPVT